MLHERFVDRQKPQGLGIEEQDGERIAFEEQPVALLAFAQRRLGVFELVMSFAVPL